MLQPKRTKYRKAFKGRISGAAKGGFNLDFGVATAFTTYGTCGVKVWIFKGEIMEHDPMAQDKRMAEADAGRPRRDAA